MRIAVVTTSYPSRDDDASGHFVRAEARKLEREGHEVRVISPDATRATSAFGWPGVAARVREKPSRAIDAARWVMTARRAIARADVDRVVAHWAIPCAWPIAIAAEHAELDVVSHGGDVRLLAKMPRSIRRAIVRAIAKRTREWRFVSASLRDDLLRVLDNDVAARVRAIAHVEAAAIEMPTMSELRARGAERRAEIGEGAPLAVSVGRLIASKRVDVALAHAATRGARIVIVGDGPERARLEARAAELGLDARFVGKLPRTDALAWMAAADVLMHASLEEGLSTVLREADAIGLPIELLP
jgi:glycosyltransferase involved in cell wall biosynthesis